ncbi:MAG: Formiminotransferase-cyclodeaminase [Clostridiales bacterium 38_11]|nr:MAG: Formiminotransferase-cyclodeaminase [Clostridiales bacterium 38_11]HBH13508.1 formiminotransferase-cyclodeaminase [Clostridiales bacterium]
MTDNDILAKIIDSDNTAVGGGASSALVGAMAAGMIAMVSKLSVKKDYGIPGEAHLAIATELDGLAKKLQDGSKKDEEAFITLMSAYRMPKSSDEEKSIRKKAIHQGSVSASNVPKENGFMCLRVYELGQAIMGNSNPNAESDLLIAIELAKIGIFGCTLNIRANFIGIRDEQVKGELEKDLEILEQYGGKK